MPPFTGSDVPLTDDILKKAPPQFILSWVEWHAINSLKIYRTATASGSTTVMFTVPINKTLYITDANMSTTDSTGGGGIKTGRMFADQEGANIIECVSNGANSGENLSVNLRMPMKIEEGGTISLIAPSNSLVRGTFHGFELDKKISP